MGTLPAVLSLFVFLFLPYHIESFAAGCVPGQVSGYKWKFRSFRTGYYPDSSTMEGGYTDRNGKPLKTLQAYLRGGAPYVSVAMDHTDRRFPYGTVVRIPAIEKYFGRCIEFRIVDTGGRFKGRGSAKIDICNDSNGNANSGFSNGMADVFVMTGGGGGFNQGGDDEEEDRPRWGRPGKGGGFWNRGRQ